MDKMRVLLSDDFLRDYIPKTKFYTPKIFAEMFKRYSFVILKPDTGRKGRGVISVRSDEQGYLVQHEKTASRYKSIEAAGAAAEALMDCEYVVQRGIELLRLKSRPIDVRVSVLKPFQRWMYSGIAIRQAEQGKIVTNRSSGGNILPFSQAILECGYREEEINSVEERIKSLSLRTAAVLTKVYPGLRELGVDIGLDSSLHPWILEVNTRPVYKLFGMLPDKSMYNTIRDYHRKIWSMVKPERKAGSNADRTIGYYRERQHGNHKSINQKKPKYN